jgi:hypothetical protein
MAEKTETNRMTLSKHLLTALIFSITCFAAPALYAANPPKPKVRAITGFITIDAKSYPSQIEDAVKFLSRVRAAIQTAGYDVQGIRISTQPFPDYTQALSRADALKLLRGMDGLAAKLNFAPSIGPAMLNDSDPTGPVDLLAEILATPGNRLNANIVTAGQDGIHWNAVRQAARVIKMVGERSPHGQGNFNFAAIAMLKPYGPFYPGAWHPAGGPPSFAIGLEGANVVMDVLRASTIRARLEKRSTTRSHFTPAQWKRWRSRWRRAADGPMPASILHLRPEDKFPLAPRSKPSRVRLSAPQVQKLPPASSRAPCNPSR